MARFLAFIPCHRRPDRTIHIHGKPMPLCARCTAIYLSYLSLPFLGSIPFSYGLLFTGIGCQLPMLIDGFTQKWGYRESTNTLRVITGTLSGLGQCLVIWFFVHLLISLR